MTATVDNFAIKPEQTVHPVKRATARAEDLLAAKCARESLQAFRDAGYRTQAVEVWVYETPKRELAYAISIGPVQVCGG